MNLENKDICRECGGECCKKSGCDYVPKDFKSLNLSNILEILAVGNTSIVSTLSFSRLANNTLTCSPILYLRVRNTGRDVIDLFSFKTPCSMLKKDGCSYDFENRPTGGKSLLPLGNEMCYSTLDQREFVKLWDSYQSTLRKVVKRITGKTVDEKLREDIKQVLSDIKDENYKGISKRELMDMQLTLPYIAEAFPKETREILDNPQFIRKRINHYFK